MTDKLLFFENYYFNILTNVFNILEYNQNILLFIKNDFNILEHFGHYIKKKNIKIDIFIEDIEIFNKINNEIKDEECEDNIKLYTNIEDINNKIYNVINIFHLNSNENFKNILNHINNLCDKNCLIYIYCSLSNEKDIKIGYKNYLRNILNQYSNINVGNILKLSDIISIIEVFSYNIISLKIYKKNNYLLYGNSVVYEIIIKK